ncbi:hypothetical protein JTB14_003103 [Gonioctena quinquepunctata]|nr:hypothetical protein JTB14_003103 [Gonioctena quinquepunctata]
MLGLQCVVVFVVLINVQTSRAIPQGSIDTGEINDKVPIETVNSDNAIPQNIPIVDETVPKLSLDPHLGGSEITCEHECVLFYLCKNGSINTNGEGIINIRDKESNSPCGDVFKVCCKAEDKSPQPLTTTPPPTPAPKGCGYRHPNGIGFKITGNNESEAQFAEYPWMVALIPHMGSSGSSQRPKCGGALIHPQAVITAAHCVLKKDDKYIIRAGEWDINRQIEPHPHQDVAVQNITLHPEFYSGALYNDIAFLYLESPVNIAENVDVLCLPTQNHQQNISIGRCYSTGWGKDRFGKEGVYHIILKSVDLPIVPRDTCQNNLRETRLGKRFELHKSFMCAGGEKGKDSCNGDGGSPLVCPIEGQQGRYYHAGIVAWGIGCGEENIPGVYTNVASFREWIDEHMRIYGLNTTTYESGIAVDERGFLALISSE